MAQNEFRPYYFIPFVTASSMIKYSNNIGKITKIIDGRGVEGGRERLQNDVWNIYIKACTSFIHPAPPDKEGEVLMSVLHYMLCC